MRAKSPTTATARFRLLWLRQGRRLVVIRWIVGMLSVMIGLPTALLTLVLGNCASFGGGCPSQSGLRGDIYGGVAIGALLTFVVPVLMWRPDRVGLKSAVAVVAFIVVPVTIFLSAAAGYGWS